MAILILLFLPQDSADPYFKFKKGTCWVYDTSASDEKKTVTFTVFKEEEGRIYVSFAREGDEPAAHVWRMKDGILFFGPDGGEEPPLPVFKAGSKKGDTWKSPDFEATHLGTAEVKVPAGTYKDAVLVSLKREEAEFRVWLVPNVGLVRLSVGDAFVAELREKKEGVEVKAPKSATVLRNERYAPGALQTLLVAESDFRSNDRDDNRVNDFWTGDVSGLYRVREQKLIDREVAEADAAPVTFEFMVKEWIPKPKPYHGYYFRAMLRNGRGEDLAKDTDESGAKCRNTSWFGFCAYPAEYGKTGAKTFIVFETVYACDNGGKFVEQWPTDAQLKESWKEVE